MRRPVLMLIVAAAAVLFGTSAQAQPAAQPRWSLAIHGGAGVIERGRMTPEMDAQYRAALTAALDRGSAVLARGGSAMDAVEAVVRGMEDDPLFNAGRGAVFTADGRNELDAAVMDGRTLAAGAVAGVTNVRHPISLARAVMERSPHVMLTGAGAEAFARTRPEIETVPPAFFFTERRWQGLETTLRQRGDPVPPRPAGAPPAPARPTASLPGDGRFGTVGAVALDQAGNLAAATSTGGVTGKRWGRVGDAPIIGAGTYAANTSCAVSATGTGEYFIRLTVAREVCALVEYRGMALQAAADDVVQRRLRAIGGDGGLVAVGPDGAVAWSLNTPGMYRARAASTGERRIAVYADEN